MQMMGVRDSAAWASWLVVFIGASFVSALTWGIAAHIFQFDYVVQVGST